MLRFKNIFTSLSLLFIAILLFLSILFYHVSAVAVYDRHQQSNYIRTIGALHSLVNCSWLSEVLIKEKVITLKCYTLNAIELYVNLDEKFKILSKLESKSVHFEEARKTFSATTGEENFELSLTYYDQKSVYWVNTLTGEWLLDMNDYSILWKVEKHNE